MCKPIRLWSRISIQYTWKNKTLSFNTQIRKTTKVEKNSAYMLENKPKIFMATETLTLEQTNEERFSL